MSGAGPAGPRYVEILERSSCFSIASFDALAAIELGEMFRTATANGGKRWPLPPEAAQGRLELPHPHEPQGPDAQDEQRPSG